MLPGGASVPADWQSTGILYLTPREGISLLPLRGDGKPRLLVRESGTRLDAKLSADGKWVAYAVNQSGRLEVLIAIVSKPALKWRISATGGSLPDGATMGKNSSTLRRTAG